MTTAQLLLSLLFLLLTGLVAIPVAHKLRLPLGAVLVALGFGLSELVTELGYDTGIRWQNFTQIIIYGLLPPLIFNSASLIDMASLRRYRDATLILAIPLVLMSTALCAVALYYMVDHASGFPWLAAFIAAALFVATDVTSVSEILVRHNVKAPVTTLIEGEGALGDAVAVALFTTLLAFATSVSETTSNRFLLTVGTSFAWSLLAGITVGWVSAKIFDFVIKSRCPIPISALISLLYVYGIYWIVEILLGASGVVALTVAGLILGEGQRRGQDKAKQDWMFKLWRRLGKAAYLLLFTLVGVTLTFDMFTERWLVMIFAVVALLLARLPAMVLAMSVQTRFLKHQQLTAAQTSVVYFGGVRGAVTIALALSLPTDLSYWWTIQSMAYGAVIFSLLVQTPLVELIIKKYRSHI